MKLRFLVKRTAESCQLDQSINHLYFTNLRERPNIPKFKQIMSAYQKQNLETLCKFIRNINKYFVL
jgi:hypothetical protein